MLDQVAALEKGDFRYIVKGMQIMKVRCKYQRETASARERREEMQVNTTPESQGETAAAAAGADRVAVTELERTVDHQAKAE